MGMQSYLKGKAGEENAKNYLEQKGYKILEQNFHSQQGEVDLIAYHGDFLVFIEVKSYSQKSWGSPLGALTRAKKNSIIHAAKTYLWKNRLREINCRFDVISIYPKHGIPEIEHIENAFFVN